MAVPAIAGMAAFVAVPFGIALWLSLHKARLGAPDAPEFFGIEQYRRILLDPGTAQEFRQALLNNAIFAVVVVPLQTSLALALAILVNRPLRAMPLFRTVFFMPVVFPMALVAVIWRLIYARDDAGLLNSVISAASFGHLAPHDWLGDPSTAMAAIILMSIWQGVGFQMVILLAGLQAIPAGLYEAAEIDGASRWQSFRSVTLPGLRNTLIFVVLVTTILSFRLFDQVRILTDGGPDDATTTVVHQSVKAAFDAGNLGKGAAMTVVLFVIVLAITLVQRGILRQEREIQ